MGYKGEERRQSRRSRSGVSLVEDTAGDGVLNRIDNISSNGVLCHTFKPIPVMTIMAITIDLPNPHARRIDAEGVVVRCDADGDGDDNYKVAILFTKMKDDDNKAIEAFVEHDLSDDSD